MIQMSILNIRSRNRLECQGFTLTELTIVLLIVSFVIGAIWVAAEPAWNNYRASRATQQVTKITQNIREYYMSAQKLPWASTTDITSNLDNLNLFPEEMRRNPGSGPGGTPIDHPFNNSLVTVAGAPANGSFHVLSMTCTNGTPLTSTCFRIQMQGLGQGPCIRLLEAIPVNDADLGVVAVGVQNMTSQNTAPSTTATPSPVTASTARGWCNQTGANNEVDWDFKLHN